ncbi:MAG: TonB-dependent receptor [Pseudomonadota bacterium]
MVVGVTLLVSAPEVLAQMETGVVDEAEVLFTLGNEAYLQGEYRRAVAHYLASNRLAPNKNVIFNVARCYERLQQYVEAYRFFSMYAESGVSTEDRARAAEGMRRVRQHVALLRVETTPPGATVYVGRRDLGSYGTTPRDLALAPATIQVLLELDGFEPVVVKDVKLAVGTETPVRVELKQIFGTLEIAGAPEGAWIRAGSEDGKELGRVPATLSLPPGSAVLAIGLDGHETLQATPVVRADQKTSLRIQLEELRGALVVQCDERDALILLDGQPVGFTPEVVENLRAGTHRLRVELEGYRPAEQDVTIAPRSRSLVEIALAASDEVAAASRSVESIQDAPASVTVISRPEIDAMGYSSLYDAALGSRSVFANDDGAYRTLGVRGLQPFGSYGNRVLVQLDGHTLNGDWVGSSFVDQDLMTSLRTIEHIEIVRGPGSALYGSNAFLGVFNLVTPRTAPRHTVRTSLFALGDGSAGFGADGGHSLGDEGGFWAAASGSLGQARDLAYDAYVGTPWAPDGVAHGVGDFQAGTVLLRGWWKDLSLQGYFNHRAKQIPTAAFGTIFGDRREHEDDQRGFLDLRYEPELASWLRLHARTYLDYAAYQGAFPYQVEDGLLTERFTGAWGGAEIRGELEPLDWLRLTLGTEYQGHFLNTAIGDAIDEQHPFHVGSGYGVLDLHPLSWLRLSAGARFDGWWITNLTTEGSASQQRLLYSVNPRLAAVLRPSDDDSIKLMVGRAFRAPSIYELTYWDGGETQIQSPGLSPEAVITAELEYNRRLMERLWLSGAVFVNYITELVTQVGEGVSNNPFYYDNSPDPVWTAGAEVELRRELSQGILASAQYSFQRTRATDLLGAQTLPNSPEHLVGLKAVVPLAGRALIGAGRLYWEFGRRDTLDHQLPPIALLDLTLSGRYQPLGLEYAAGLRNALDWEYRLPVGEDIADTTLRQPGRSFYLSLSYAL